MSLTKWDKYYSKVIIEANKQKKDENYISAYLAYVKPLFDKNVPIIVEPSHFSKLVGLQHEYVCKMAYSPSSFYRSFAIKKANGKERNIDEPLPDLKMVQRWILDEILYKIPISKYAKAFIPGRSLKHNARFHRAQNIVITLDVKDFFPSIKINEIYQIFYQIGYKENIASFLANLCCLRGELPQGAPTSPCLSNIRMEKIDTAFGHYCICRGIRYTRYADDLTFSGNINISELILFVSGTLFENGFVLNSSKTRVAKRNARQEVTGIVVNHHMQVTKSERKELRQQLYYIQKYGLESHLEYIKETRQSFIRHLLGRVNFALFVNPKDVELQRYASYLKELLHAQIEESNEL